MTKLSVEAVIEAIESDDNAGFCVECGAEAEGVEPDAERYRCEECGELAVYGAEQLLVCGFVG